MRLWQKFTDRLNEKIDKYTDRRKRWFHYYGAIRPKLGRLVESLSSRVPISVVIPSTVKDIDVLPYCIRGIQRNLAHPIAAIIVVSPKNERMIDLCRELGCEFLDESELVSFEALDIRVSFQGKDRSKWIYQQFLKLSGEKASPTEHYLVVDSDTVLVRKQTFISRGRIVLNFSDEWNLPYFEAYRRLFGVSIEAPVSFTSHQMLFSRRFLTEMKAAIERRSGMDWKKSILACLDPNVLSGHSDYDTYGQFVFANFRRRTSIRYWFNKSLPRQALLDNNLLEATWGSDFKSVSFHSWNDNSVS